MQEILLRVLEDGVNMRSLVGAWKLDLELTNSSHDLLVLCHDIRVIDIASSAEFGKRLPPALCPPVSYVETWAFGHEDHKDHQEQERNHLEAKREPPAEPRIAIFDESQDIFEPVFEIGKL